MPEWMQAAISIGTASGGTGVLLFALKSALPSFARWLASRARVEEVTAETVQSMLDEMRGRVSRIEEEAKRRDEEHQADLADCEARTLAIERHAAEEIAKLKARLTALQIEHDELRRAVASSRPSVPIVAGAPAPVPTARLEVVKKMKGDER